MDFDKNAKINFRKIILNRVNAVGIADTSHFFRSAGISNLHTGNQILSLKTPMPALRSETLHNFISLLKLDQEQTTMFLFCYAGIAIPEDLLERNADILNHPTMITKPESPAITIAATDGEKKHTPPLRNFRKKNYAYEITSEGDWEELKRLLILTLEKKHKRFSLEPEEKDIAMAGLHATIKTQDFSATGTKRSSKHSELYGIQLTVQKINERLRLFFKYTETETFFTLECVDPRLHERDREYIFKKANFIDT